MLSDFVQHLIADKFIKEDDVKRLLKESREKKKFMEDLILENKIISEEIFFKEKGKFYQVPLRKIKSQELSQSILKEIPEITARRYKIIPLERTEKILKIGMVEPEDFSAKSVLDFIASQKNIKIEVCLISSSDFNEAVKKYKFFKKEIENAVERLREEEQQKGEQVSKIVLERATEEAPISKIVSVIIKHAIDGKASDIHIEPFKDEMRVRFRVDGILYPSLSLEKKFLASVISRIKILSNLRIDETRIPQDGRFTTIVGEKKINFRVATFPTPGGEKIAIRILNPSVATVGFDKLGIKGKTANIVKRFMKLPFGMVIFCGPTGSGKTTSQYTILRELDKKDLNIVTLEDPVEYWIDGVNQSQIRPEIGYTFASGLRQILRQDPDVIMIGEIRDEETASLAVHAALTGHLVLSTLHTNTAIGAIPRFIDMGVEPFLIPVALKFIVSQRLIRRLCSGCKERVKANKEEENIIKDILGKIPESEKKLRKIRASAPFYLFKARGCSKCFNKGTSGRIGLYEVLIMTKQLEGIIINRASRVEISDEALRQNMITLKQDGIMKALDGLVALEEVFRATEEKREII